MSVYTSVSHDTLQTFLSRYEIGDLLNFEGISAGIENTNYFIYTTQGKYVLTLFETLGPKELPYFLNLMAFLAEHQVPSAHPVADNQNQYLQTLQNKPAVIVHCLQGAEAQEVTTQHAKALGAALAKLHLAGQQFEQQQANSRGPHWWHDTITKLEGHIPTQEFKILESEIEFQMTMSHTDLPRGVTHADLFKDNVLWEKGKISGFIDFYYACNDVLLYDIAVTCNAWFSDQKGNLNQELSQEFLAQYDRIRPLNAIEHKAWPVMLRAAALRFWLSRLNDKYFPKAGELTHLHDPDEFKLILMNRIDNHSLFESESF
ncbi:Homoserine kinase [hydrothermal vent metagenome]|uniref:Homoserine kinase n=1 Tax=hydrothermal vent metagenome TaxID=652676 RepID=A0A3B0YYK8_9ZZZZ